MPAAITKTMAFDSVPEESTDAPDAIPEVEGAAEAAPMAEGETLSLDVFGGNEPAIGDMVTLKVTAIDPENGTVSVMLPAAKKTGGIAGAATALDETV